MLVITSLILGFTLANKIQFIKGLVAIAIVGPLTGILILSFPHISGWIGVGYNFIAMMPWIIHILKTKKLVVFQYGRCT
jgi:hypothetical protein